MQTERVYLLKQLRKAHAFWSYASPDAHEVPDEELIEKTLTYLELKDISLLFQLFDRAYVRRVWRERMAVQGDYLFRLNVMIALLYFDIRQPERYLRRVEQQHLKRLCGQA